jgi:hypothetical protein
MCNVLHDLLDNPIDLSGAETRESLRKSLLVGVRRRSREQTAYNWVCLVVRRKRS